MELGSVAGKFGNGTASKLRTRTANHISGTRTAKGASDGSPN